MSESLFFEHDNGSMEEALLSRPYAVFASPNRAYTSSMEHLWDELRRIELLVRACTRRWQATTATSKPPEQWGMVIVQEAEIDDYLHAPFQPPGSLPRDLMDVMYEEWSAAAEMTRLIAGRRAQTPPALDLRLERLQRLFDLSDLERDVVLVSLLPELDGRYRRLYGYLMDDVSRGLPTVELVLQILLPQMSGQQEARALFDPGGPLLARRLLVPDAEPRRDEPLSTRAVRLDDRVVDYLLGSDRPDGRLSAFISFTASGPDWADLLIEPSLKSRLKQLAPWIKATAETDGAVVLLHGPYGSGRRAGAQALCAAVYRPLLAVDVGSALQSSLPWTELVERCYREAALQGAALYWEGGEKLFDSRQPTPRWETLAAAAEQHPVVSFLACETGWDPAGSFRQRPFLHLAFPPPTYLLRVKLWEHHLSTSGVFLEPELDPAILARDLANDFQFTGGQIVDALMTANSEAVARSPRLPRLSRADLYEGSRRQSGRQLISFAHRIEPRALTLDDLVLPAANKRQLEELRDRIQLRSRVYADLGFERRLSLGRGLIALFTGTSGTGKTMAAELLAGGRGVDLYKVDLSAVASKWVGETEKNLSRVFAEAEGANAILFFDEADAIFGKRGEVKEAQDRWANMEVNYLLQRVEEYSGTVILASNLKQNMDEAFLRRIQFIVEFPAPDERARRRIYEITFPPTVAPPETADLEEMAGRFRLTGGSIKNVVVEATFRALAEGCMAADGRPQIALRHLVLATAREYQKPGKPLTKSEFGADFYRWVETEILLTNGHV